MSEKAPPLPEVRNRENMLAWRKAYHEWNNRVQESEAQARKKREEAEQAALRQPPARAWRIGRWIGWEPPVTYNKKQPYFWISQEFEPGKWSMNGDWLQHHIRESSLMHDGAARVESYYPNEVGGKGPRYCSEVLKAGPEPWWLVGRVRGYASFTQHGQEYVNLWLRVLAAFGALQPMSVRGNTVDPTGHLPMTASEARSYADRGLSQVRPNEWGPVADYLERVSGVEPRSDRIKNAISTFDGKHTVKGYPYVRPLRKHAEMPDISVKERNECCKELG